MSSQTLTPVPPPRATVTMFEQQLPLTPDGITVERYTTANHYIFEKHINAQGVAHWFLVGKSNA